MTAPRIPTAPELAKAVLLFWQPGPWTDADAAEWKRVTGHDDVTGRVLGDMARAVLEADVRIDLGPGAGVTP